MELRGKEKWEGDFCFAILSIWIFEPKSNKLIKN